jgi:beta-aspartyl-peptidase (threonine type)
VSQRKRLGAGFAVLASALLLGGSSCGGPEKAPAFALVIHGGAGTIRKAEMPPGEEAEIRAALAAALERGASVLRSGGSSLDAVEAVVRTLEDDPHFNAGKGAVFNHEGVNELDACIMDGATGKAGAVAAVHRVKNPILLARAVMERSKHVLLVGDGAEAFAKACGVELVAPAYFYTEARWKSLQRALERDAAARGSAPASKEHGTVGAVALDIKGHLAAATSTGGLTDKRFGRVGDSPIVGDGTYADDATCAVSCTGTGEYFMRSVAAYDVAARMRYGHASVGRAAADVIGKIGAAGGDGGMIALDGRGRLAMPFNTEGMYRGYLDGRGKPVVLLYGDESPRP